MVLNDGQSLALKLFKGAVTSDGLPEHEIAGSLAAGPHPALSTPVAELQGHPDGTRGMLLPLIPATHTVLAGPPSMVTCTRDVYEAGIQLSATRALKVARQVVGGLAHLHARGVMHGDFYAHNILWNPATGDALLSDMGAATVLPATPPTLRHGLLSLEVRAVGCLLEELVMHVPTGDTAAGPLQLLRQVAGACLAPDSGARPSLAEVLQTLEG